MLDGRRVGSSVAVRGKSGDTIVEVKGKDFVPVGVHEIGIVVNAVGAGRRGGTDEEAIVKMGLHGNSLKVKAGRACVGVDGARA